MVEQLTLQTLIMFIQAAGILVAAIYHIMTLRNQSKSRQIQILNAVNSRELNWDFSLWEFSDYEDFMSRYGPDSNPEGWKDVMDWFNRLESFGVYVREGLLDIRLVCLMSGGTIKNTWERYHDIFREFRLRNNLPRYFIEAEYLYEKVVNYLVRHPELGI